MSAVTPAASTPDASATASSPAPVPASAATNATAGPSTQGASTTSAASNVESSDMSSTDSMIIDYLRTRGYTTAEQAFREALQTPAADKSNTPPSVSAEDLAKKIAVYAPKPTKPNENALQDSATVLAQLGSMGNPANIQSLIASIGPIGADDILSLDPTDKQEGFRELEAWVEGSLDMYKPEFRPILFPIFCHFYLDLIQHGFKEAAMKFYAEFSPPLQPQHSAILHHLSTLLLPQHVQNDEHAQRFRNEKYQIRMSRSGFSLLVGWLTEGVGGEAFGAGDGFTGERGKRGRAAVMRVVNNHLKFDEMLGLMQNPVATSNTTSTSATSWEETTGLLSSLIPQTNGTGVADVNAFNASKGDLKLGPAPISEELRSETERMLREQVMVDRDPAQFDYMRPQPPPGVISPTSADMPPHPPLFKTVDVRREVEKVKDARKRIRLDPSVLHGANANTPQARLWSLKGKKLKGYRSDFQTNSVKDAASLQKQREKGGSTTRKLIGHSGPVYAVDFDPTSGSADAPKYLLSASADATTRLWSLDTMTNVVAYRGHQNPVWDVQWSPTGIYFATASRDKTARLWSTDRTSALRIYAGHLGDVESVRFHPNSLYLATASSDWTARLWDVQRGSCIRVFIGHQDIVSTLAFSPDGKYLASASEDLSISLWDLGSGKRIKKMTGHTASIYSLAFSAESSLLVSGSADWTVRCWDVKSAGGLPGKNRENGIVNGDVTENGHDPAEKQEESNQTVDLLSTFPTKRTPIINVQFTPRNLCLVAGPYLSPEQR
ncbi:hypothetical protein EIP86_007582 [Pleurotus ostreatoroseus]|nr:hypothetical protein EIP86_007582 [Pleurotus ostreatoroseus]